MMSEVHVNGSFIVVQEPQIKTVGETKVANVAGMVVEKVGKGDAQKDIFSYFDLEVWDKAAEYVDNNVRKGDTFVVLDGTLRQNRWEKDGEKHSKTIIRVKSFLSVAKKESSE